MTDVVEFKTSLPADYDPEKGLKTAKMAQAAEQYWTRAKDAEGLYHAIETKLDAQAEYIVWRDSQVQPSQEAPPPLGMDGAVARVNSNSPRLPDADPGKEIAYRWREKFTMNVSDDGKRHTEIDANKLALAKQNAKEKCRQICEQEGGRGPARTAESVERETRPSDELDRIERARERWADDDDIEIKDNAKIKDIDGGFEITMVGTVYE
jgi:hypothetical protein